MKSRLKFEWLILLVLGVLFSSQTAFAAPGDLDTTFNSTGKRRVGVGGGEDYANAMARQTDGKLIVAGQSAGIDGAIFSLVRYNTNSTLDTTFGARGKVLTYLGAESGVNALAILPDGKILAAGYTRFIAGDSTTEHFALAKYNSNGTLDTTFGTDGVYISHFYDYFPPDNQYHEHIGDRAKAIAVQPDGKIVLVGSGVKQEGTPHSITTVARYTSNGGIDTSFAASIYDYHGAAGHQDFGAGDIGGVLILSGKIYFIQDDYNNPNQNYQHKSYLYCLNSDGTGNDSFNTYNRVQLNISTSENSRAHSLAILAVYAGEEKIIVAGETSTRPTSGQPPSPTHQTLWSIDANNGSDDTSFGSGGRVVLPVDGSTGRAVRIQNSSGTASRIVVAGNVNDNFMAARYLLNGTPDTAFNGGGSVIADFGNSNDFATAMVIQPTDNKIVVAGFSKTSTTLGTETKVSDNDFQTLRFNTNGSLDTTFGGDGRRLDDTADAAASAQAVTVQSDGKIIVAGDKSVARFNADGSSDTTFDEDGKIKIPFGAVRAGVTQPDGKIVLAAEFSGEFSYCPFFIVFRLNVDGTLDTTFDTDGIAIVRIGNLNAFPKAIAIQPNGAIVVAGYINNGSHASPYYYTAVVRLLTNGALDTSFNYGAGTSYFSSSSGDDRGNAVAIQPDGKIVVAGSSANGLDKDFAVFRFNANGSPDNTFDGDGKQTIAFGSTDEVANAVAIQSGKIIVAGYAHVNITDDFAVALFNTNGTLDTSFGSGGKTTTPIGTHNDAGNALALQADGKILVAGSSESAQSVNEFAVVRYNANGSLDNSYSTDGKVTVDVSSGDDFGNAIALDSSGRAVVVGQANGLFGIARLLGDAPLVQTYEADVLPRGNGNGAVSSTDVSIIQGFQLGFGLPYQSNEFQRADCAPFSSRGDGRITSVDVSQAQGYQLGFNLAAGSTIQPAAGPTAPTSGSAPEFDNAKPSDQADETQWTDEVQALRDVRVTPTMTGAGQTVTVPIAVDAMGDESVYGFSLNYDSTRLSNPVVSIGNAGGSVSSNTSIAGRIGVSVTYGGGTITAGNGKVLISVQFTVANNAAAGATPINFTDQPTFREVASAPGTPGGVQALPTTFTNGNLTVTGTTAAMVSVSGRVLTPAGKGLTSAAVLLTDSSGITRSARTSALGYYRFDEVEVGQNYILSVRSKRYRFAARVLSVTEDLDELDLTAESTEIRTTRY